MVCFWSVPIASTPHDVPQIHGRWPISSVLRAVEDRRFSPAHFAAMPIPSTTFHPYIEYQVWMEATGLLGPLTNYPSGTWPEGGEGGMGELTNFGLLKLWAFSTMRLGEFGLPAGRTSDDDVSVPQPHRPSSFGRVHKMFLVQADQAPIQNIFLTDNFGLCYTKNLIF